MTKHSSSHRLPDLPIAAVEAVAAAPYHAVVGLDVGDRRSHYCVLDLTGAIVAATLGVAGTVRRENPFTDHKFTLWVP